MKSAGDHARRHELPKQADPA